MELLKRNNIRNVHIFLRVKVHRIKHSNFLKILLYLQQLVSSRDITVDYDQVRAAMASITLPPSSIPPWASSIPDSEWCTYLQNRIRILQEQDKKCD